MFPFIMVMTVDSGASHHQRALECKQSNGRTTRRRNSIVDIQEIHSLLPYALRSTSQRRSRRQTEESVCVDAQRKSRTGEGGRQTLAHSNYRASTGGYHSYLGIAGQNAIAAIRHRGACERSIETVSGVHIGCSFFGYIDWCRGLYH